MRSRCKLVRKWTDNKLESEVKQVKLSIFSRNICESVDGCMAERYNCDFMLEMGPPHRYQWRALSGLRHALSEHCVTNHHAYPGFDIQAWMKSKKSDTSSIRTSHSQNIALLLTYYTERDKMKTTICNRYSIRRTISKKYGKTQDIWPCMPFYLASKVLRKTSGIWWIRKQQ